MCCSPRDLCGRVEIFLFISIHACHNLFHLCRHTHLSFVFFFSSLYYLCRCEGYKKQIPSLPHVPYSDTLTTQFAPILTMLTKHLHMQTMSHAALLTDLRKGTELRTCSKGGPEQWLVKMMLHLNKKKKIYIYIYNIFK